MIIIGSELEIYQNIFPELLYIAWTCSEVPSSPIKKHWQVYIRQLTEYYMKIPGSERGNYNVNWKIHSFIHSFPAAFLGLGPDTIWRHSSNQEHNVLALGQKFYYGKKQQQVETSHSSWGEWVKRMRLRANQQKIKWTMTGLIFCFCFSAQHLLKLILQSTNLINTNSTQSERMSLNTFYFPFYFS